MVDIVIKEDFMALIGFILLLSIIGTITGITGVILTSALSIWAKIILISLEVFIFSIVMANRKIKNEEKEND